MITFKEKDLAITNIRKKTRLTRFPLKNDYRVFGIARSSQEDVRLCFRIQYFFDNFDKQNILTELFNKARISINLVPGDQYKSKLYIGFSRNLRKNIPLTVAILETIILFFEDRIKINPTFEIPFKKIS